MKRFNSFLAESMEEFIEYRLQLGYSDRTLICNLRVLDKYLVDKKSTWSSLDPLFFIRFRSNLNCENRYINTFFRTFKMFFNKNYRSEERTIYIERTKFKKDRLIPIPKAVSCEIDNLINVRRLFLVDDHPLLLIKESGEGLSRAYFARKFKKAISMANLNQPRRVIGTTNFSSPTRHSFRHAFAVNTLKRIKQQGKSPQNALPVLAAYMGHSEYKYTTKYLRVLDAEHRRQMLDFSILRSEDV